jgi:hypothetical protein
MESEGVALKRTYRRPEGMTNGVEFRNFTKPLFKLAGMEAKDAKALSFSKKIK